MTRTGFTILMLSIAIVVLALMWFAWRARAKRDTAALSAVSAGPGLAGELVARFPRASYVSTTPVGSPLERVSVPGLRYKGFADVELRSDGVSIAVTGERPVFIGAGDILGSATAGSRIGKTVERDGLSLLRWRVSAADNDVRELESSFRLAGPREQLRFADAIHRVAGAPNSHPSNTQEDA